MFFVLSKVFGFFAIPSNVITMMGCIGLLLVPIGFARLGGWLAGASVILLAVIGFLPIGNALLIPLENRFPSWDPARGAPKGIVVLGGAIDGRLANDQISLNEGAERVTVVPELARRYPNARILFSGGSAALIHQGGAEADVAVELLGGLGVSRDRVVLENGSRNTAENAAFSKNVGHPGPGELWLLVTTAYHMPRAIGCFRKVGFPVDPYPVDWRTRGADDLLRPLAMVSVGLERTDTAVREWIGLLVYWLTGRTSEFFPGPLPSGQ